MRQAQSQAKALVEGVSSEQELRDVVIELTEEFWIRNVYRWRCPDQGPWLWSGISILKKLRLPGNQSRGLCLAYQLSRRVQHADSNSGDLAIIAAETSHGKDCILALQILNHAAFEQKLGVSVFSLEMSNNQILNQDVI